MTELYLSEDYIGHYSKIKYGLKGNTVVVLIDRVEDCLVRCYETGERFHVKKSLLTSKKPPNEYQGSVEKQVHKGANTIQNRKRRR